MKLMDEMKSFKEANVISISKYKDTNQKITS